MSFVQPVLTFANAISRRVVLLGLTARWRAPAINLFYGYDSDVAMCVRRRWRLFRLSCLLMSHSETTQPGTLSSLPTAAEIFILNYSRRNDKNKQHAGYEIRSNTRGGNTETDSVDAARLRRIFVYHQAKDDKNLDMDFCIHVQKTYTKPYNTVMNYTIRRLCWLAKCRRQHFRHFCFRYVMSNDLEHLTEVVNISEKKAKNENLTIRPAYTFAESGWIERFAMWSINHQLMREELYL